MENVELEKLVNQLNVKKSEFNELDLESYGLGILVERETWNDVVRICPINNLYIYDRRDWNELNEISQLDLSIVSLGKNWDDIVEEGRDALNIAGDEKDPLKHQKIELLQINGQPILEKWLDEIQPNNAVDSIEIQKSSKNENVIEKNNGIEIYSLEKEPNTIQKINYIFVGGQKRPWKNLAEDREILSIEKVAKEGRK